MSAVGWLGLDWGTVPDWLVGVGTVGTLVAAVSTLAKDRAESRRQRMYQRSAQAREVHLGSVQRKSVSGVVGQQMRMSYTVAVTNQSAEVIHDVKLALWIMPAAALYDQARPARRVELPVLPPGETLTCQLDTVVKDVRGQGPVDHECRVEASFTDLSGQRWIRGPDYRLRSAEAASRPPLPLPHD